MSTDAPDSNYIMHSDNEIVRLTYQHRVIQDAMGGELVLAPIDFRVSPLEILDTCTADGIWLRDLQSAVGSQHTFVGTDIEKSYFPSEPPKNTTFHIQDVSKPWPEEWNNKFDLVHQRLALACPGDEKATLDVLGNFVKMVKPGGWIQLVEFQDWVADDDGQAWKDYARCLCNMIEYVGSTVKHIDRSKVWFEQLGLVDVEEKVFEANYGTRDDKDFQKIAKTAAIMTATSIIGVTSTFSQEQLTLPKARIPDILPDLKKEMETDPVKAHWRYKVVWGRKPE